MSNGHRTSDLEGPYGAYQVVRGLVRAPGAWLTEGRDPGNLRCILQLARCKPATDPEAKRDRDEYVGLIATATQHLAADPDIELLDHSASHERDGSLMLYWAMPWVDGADHLGRTKIKSTDELANIAFALLETMSQRHDRGRLSPTLSDQVLIISRDRPPVQIGLPIHLPPGWLTSDVPAPRLAPEERERAEPRLSGDIWRVGRTLRALGAHLTNWPKDLSRVVDRMDAEKVGDRFSSAHSALLEIESLHQTLVPPPEDSGSSPSDAETEDHAAAPAVPSDDLDPPRIRRMLDGPPVGREAATVRVELTPSDRRHLFGPDDPDADGAFTETIVDKPRPDLGTQRPSRPDPEATLQDVAVSSLGPRPPVEPDKSPHKTEASTRRTVWDKADAVAPPPTKPTGPKGTVVGVRLINEPTGLRNTPDSNLPTILPPPQIVAPGPDLPADPRVSPEHSILPPPQTPTSIPGGPTVASPTPALPGPALQGPVLQSPVAPAAALAGAAAVGMTVPRSGALGSPIPLGSQDGLRPPTASPVPPAPISTDAASAPYAGGPSKHGVQVAPESSFARSATNVIVAIVFFAAGIGAALVGQSFVNAPDPEPERATAPKKLQIIQPAGEVLLQASPPDAVVVSEYDGQILGKTPLRFLVPDDVDYAVLVTAKGHEPTRLVLPDRGRLRTDLVPIAAERKPCRVMLRTPKSEKLTGVSEAVPYDDLYTVKGATVVRSPTGTGAWLVRCPGLGGATSRTLPLRERPVAHRLSILSPSGATISIDGEKKGQVPFLDTIRARFVRVKAETMVGGPVERWIPMFAPTRLKMPKPSRPVKATK